MSKFIYDILPPHFHNKAKAFWQQNSGRVKLGAVLLFMFAFVGMGIFVFSNIFIKSKSAQAAVSYQGVSNLIATNGGAPGALNIGTAQIGDLLVFYHYGRATGGNETVSLAGFTNVFDTVTANQGHVAVKYRIKQSSDTTFTATVTNYTSGNSGETILEWIEYYRGFDATTPIVDYTASLSTWASSTNIGSIVAPASATVLDGEMAVVFGGRFENVTGQTTLSGDNLTWTARTLNNSSLGSDAGAVTQNGLNSSGSNQTITAKTITTTGTAQAGAGRMFIIKKAPEISVAATGTQTPSVEQGSTANYAGGTFRLTRSYGGSTNITTIRISETDTTLTADTYITNAALKYGLDITTPYDCVSESYGGTESTFASGVSFLGETATFTNVGVAITSTQTFCGYLIYDVGSGAPAGDTAEFEITNASDVVDSVSSLAIGVPAVMSGATQITIPMSVSGSLCNNDEQIPCVSKITTAETIVLKKSGSGSCTATACTTTVDGSGNYIVSNITGAAANDVFTIYVGGTASTDNNATYNAVTVTKINANDNLTGIDLITNRIVLRQEIGIANITNSDLAGWDKDNDADIKFTSNAGAFVSDNTEEVHVWDSKKWTPGGTVTTNATSTASGTGGDLHIHSLAGFDIGANVLSVGGDFQNEGTFTKSSGQTTTFTATGTGFIITPFTSNFENIIFNGASGGWGFTSTPTMVGSLTITTGVLTPGQNMTVGGSWTNSVGSAGFVPGTYGVTFNTSATAVINGATTWNNFTVTTAGKIINFQASTTQTINGLLTITGTSGNEVVINSASAPTQWTVKHLGTESVNYASVTNSGCDAASTNIDTTNSFNGGTNGSCWVFGGAATLTQRAYIFEDDDGANVNVNNSQAASNTARVSVKKGERLNVRIQIDNTGSGAASAATYDLQACNFTDTACDAADEWATVSGSTDIRPSWGLSGGSGDDLTASGADRAVDTTASGTDCVQAGPTFDATANTSEWYENTGTSNSITLTNNKCYEMSFGVHTGAATLNKEYRFRIVKTTGATVLDGYSQYPTLTIASSEDKRYSKDTPTSLGSTSSDLTYYLDNRGYNYVLTDDNTNRDFNAALGGTNIPVLNTAYKYSNADEFPSVRWNGQSNVAPSTRTLTLEAFRFGASNAWETVTTNNTTGVDTDFELSTAGWAPAGPESDYYSSSWAYFRVYQTAGIETIKTDWVNFGTYRATAYVISQTFDTITNGVGYQAIMWKGIKPNGTNVKIQLATSNCSNGATNYPVCTTGAWGATGSDYIGGAACDNSNYYTPPPSAGIKVTCYAQHNNKRYFRYKVFLDANVTRDLIPKVDDIIVAWSP